MVIVYHENTEREEREHIQDLKNKAEYSTTMESEKELSRTCKMFLLQNERKKKKNRKQEIKRK